jgi:hypothetical protein
MECSKWTRITDEWMVGGNVPVKHYRQGHATEPIRLQVIKNCFMWDLCRELYSSDTCGSLTYVVHDSAVYPKKGYVIRPTVSYNIYYNI